MWHMSPSPCCSASECVLGVPCRTGWDSVLWVEVDMGRCWPTVSGWAGGRRLGGERQVLYVERGAMQWHWSRAFVVCSHLLISLAPCFTAILLLVDNYPSLQFPRLSLRNLRILQISSRLQLWGRETPGMTCGNLLPNDVFIRRPVVGSFPTSFIALTQFTSLHLENTALGALPATLQNLTSLASSVMGSLGRRYPQTRL